WREAARPRWWPAWFRGPAGGTTLVLGGQRGRPAEEERDAQDQGIPSVRLAARTRGAGGDAAFDARRRGLARRAKSPDPATGRRRRRSRSRLDRRQQPADVDDKRRELLLLLAAGALLPVRRERLAAGGRWRVLDPGPPDERAHPERVHVALR